MSIATRIEAIEQHLLDDYSVLTLAGADLTNVDKNIINLKQTWEERLLYFINNGTEVVWNNWNKVQGSGYTLTLNNTLEAPMTIEYKGNTSQGENPTPITPQDIHIVSGDNSINVCGKNILDLSGFVTHNNYGGLNISYSNGKLLIDGTATSNIDIYLLTTGWNTKGQELSNIINSQISYLTLSSTKSDLIYYFQINGAYIQNTINRANPTDNITNMFVRIPNGTSFNNEEIGIQLERNSQPSTYEAYKGASYEINLGKNLLNMFVSHNAGYSTTIRGITFTLNENGSITINGTNDGTGLSDFYVFGSWGATTTQLTTTKNCIFSSSSTITNGNVNTFIVSGSTAITTLQSTNASGSVPANTNITALLVRVLSGQTINNITLNLQLEEGTSATSYSPYFTPIELCKIGNYQDRIFKSSGKNLIDISQTQIGIAWNNTSNSARAVCYVKVQPNNTYTASLLGVGSLEGVYYFGKENTTDSTATMAVTQINTTRTFTTTETTNYIGIQYNKTNITQEDIESAIVMLNKGSTALPYEPYGKDWYLNKQIGKVVLNGSESWTLDSANSRFYNIDYINDYMVNQRTNAITNYYRYGDSASDGYFALSSSSNYLFIHFPNSSTNTVALFKTWLESHNIELYYILNTPTYEKITGELLNQLEAIKKSYENQTNINQENNDLPFELSVSALEKY